MISRDAVLCFGVIALILANVLLFRAFSRGPEPSAQERVYQYSKDFARFFLYMIPIWAGMALVIGFSGSAPHQSNNLVASSALALAMIALPLFGYAYVKRYRVIVDERGITITSLFRTRFIAFGDIAATATMSGRGKDYWLFSPRGECIAKIGGSIENFSSLQYDVESGTRSRSVTLYDFEVLRGWQERTNEPDDNWRMSKGPLLIRERNRRVTITMVIGGVLLALLVAYIHYYLR